MYWLLFFMGVLWGGLLAVVWCLLNRVNKLESQYADLVGDMTGMGESAQKCFDELGNHTVQMQKIINKQQEAIDYLTKELR